MITINMANVQHEYENFIEPTDRNKWCLSLGQIRSGVQLLLFYPILLVT